MPEKEKRRLLYNKGQMAYKLRGANAGDPPRIFASGTAIEPLDDAEEKFLLDYHDVVYADSLVVSPSHTELTSKISRLEKENAELQEKLRDKSDRPKK